MIMESVDSCATLAVFTRVCSAIWIVYRARKYTILLNLLPKILGKRLPIALALRRFPDLSALEDDSARRKAIWGHLAVYLFDHDLPPVDITETHLLLCNEARNRLFTEEVMENCYFLTAPRWAGDWVADYVEERPPDALLNPVSQEVASGRLTDYNAVSTSCYAFELYSEVARRRPDSQLFDMDFSFLEVWKGHMVSSSVETYVRHAYITLVEGFGIPSDVVNLPSKPLYIADPQNFEGLEDEDFPMVVQKNFVGTLVRFGFGCLQHFLRAEEGFWKTFVAQNFVPMTITQRTGDERLKIVDLLDRKNYDRGGDYSTSVPLYTDEVRVLSNCFELTANRFVRPETFPPGMTWQNMRGQDPSANLTIHHETIRHPTKGCVTVVFQVDSMLPHSSDSQEHKILYRLLPGHHPNNP